MKKLALLACIVIGASLGGIAGQREAPHVAEAPTTRSAELRAEVEDLRVRFIDVKREVDAASTPAAATAAREKLFQLRVDMVVIADELAVLAGRRATHSN
jgi:hypothetical protein